MKLPAGLSDSPALLPPGSGVSRGMSGYMLSSMELRSGLDVQAISTSRLPLDLLSELLRLHDSWPKPATAIRQGPAQR